MCVFSIVWETGTRRGPTNSTQKVYCSWGLNPQPSCCEAIANDVTVLHSVYCFKSEIYDLIDFRPERYVRYWY